MRGDTPDKKTDEFWMRKALSLARRGEGFTRPNPPVGAVVVSRGIVVGTGFHREAGGRHAEVLALEQAGPRARGATLFVTLEPCCTWGRTGPCTEAILKAGVARVVAATRDPNPCHMGRGLQKLRQSGVQVTEGVCAREGQALVRPFAKWVNRGIPFLTLKLATTLDGRIADRNGHSRWISCDASRYLVWDLRKRVDAIMVGAGTVNADDPALLCRNGSGKTFRIVLTSDGRIPREARILTDDAASRTIIATTRRCPASLRSFYEKTVGKVLVLPQVDGLVSVRDLMHSLGRMGLLHVLCEGGGRLAASLVARRLVDEYIFFLAPRLLGGDGVPVLAKPGWILSRAPALKFTQVRRVGTDVLVRAVPLLPGGPS